MAREKNEQIWIAGGVVSSLLLAAAAWTFVVSPQLAEVDSLHTQTADAQTQNLVLQSTVSKLQNEYAHIGDTKRQLTDAQAQLPADTALSALTTQLSDQARASHVSITSLTAATPAPFVASAPAGSTSSATPAPAAAAAAPTGLYSIQVSLAVSGTPAAELAFARAVQHTGPRAALVSSVQLQNSSGSTGGSGKGSTMTVQLNVFVAPAAAPAPAATPTTGA